MSLPSDSFGRLVSRADAALRPLEYGLNLAGGLLVFCLMLLGVVQIVLRTVFAAPIFGYIDIVEATMIGFAILGISHVQQAGGHVRMELLIQRFKGRALWIMELFGTVLASLLISILIPYSYTHFLRAWTFGDSTIDIELPTWPAKLIVPLALSLLLMRLILQSLGYLRLVRNPLLEPIGVPMIKPVKARADEEAAGSV